MKEVLPVANELDKMKATSMSLRDQMGELGYFASASRGVGGLGFGAYSSVSP